MSLSASRTSHYKDNEMSEQKSITSLQCMTGRAGVQLVLGELYTVCCGAQSRQSVTSETLSNSVPVSLLSDTSRSTGVSCCLRYSSQHGKKCPPSDMLMKFRPASSLQKLTSMSQATLRNRKAWHVYFREDARMCQPSGIGGQAGFTDSAQTLGVSGPKEVQLCS